MISNEIQEVSWTQFLGLSESIAAQILEVTWTQFLSLFVKQRWGVYLWIPKLASRRLLIIFGKWAVLIREQCLFE